MTHDLHRLVYFSRNRLPGPPEAVADAIRGILAVSQANNNRAGVTGALMFNDGYFAQVLEGPRNALEATFERIQQDGRHGTVTLLSFGPVPSRGFPNWSMGFVGGKDDGTARYADIAAESGFEPSRMTGDQIFAVLTNLMLEQDATVA